MAKVRGSWQRLGVHGKGLRFMAKISATLRPAASQSGMYVRSRMSSLETSVQRRGSKSRTSLHRAEIIYYITQSPRGHELSLDILARGQS